MFKAFLERRRLKKTFERYVTPEVARQIGDGTFDLSVPAPAERTIEVIFVALPAPDVTTYSERLTMLAQLAEEHSAVIHKLSPVAVFAFGDYPTPPGSRLALVAAVQSRFSDAAIVHGSVSAHVGSFGSSALLEFGFWWPGMLDAVRQLATLSPGHVHELPPNERIA